MQEYDYSIVIGRFSPIHMSHVKMLNFALSKSKKLIIFIGSSTSFRTDKNPWLANERIEMIRSCFSKEENENIILIPIKDYSNDNDWKKEIYNNLPQNNTKILIGCNKDSSSYYLNLFDDISFNHFDLVGNINATDIREKFFINESGWEINLHPYVTKFLINWKNKYSGDII